jgi:hypothetical protein
MSVNSYPKIGPGSVSANIAFGAASASVAIPNNSAAAAPRVVRLAATQPCRVRFGPSGLTAVATDMLVQPQNDVYVYMAGNTHVAAIQESTGGNLSITALEDQR